MKRQTVRPSRLNASTAACAGNADRNFLLILSVGPNPNAKDERGLSPMEVLRSLKPFEIEIIADQLSKIVEKLARRGARFEPADLCLLDALRRSVGLGPRTLELLEEVEIYEEIGSSRLVPRQRACCL